MYKTAEKNEVMFLREKTKLNRMLIVLSPCINLGAFISMMNHWCKEEAAVNIYTAEY